MNFKFHLRVILLAIFLSVILSWPLLANIGSYYTDQGDYPLGGTILWYNSDSIKTGRIFNQKEYFQGFQFYPHPYSLAFANNYFAPSLIFSPIYWISDNLPFSVNSYAFLTLILSFLASFYTFKYFTKSVLASAIGAFIFTFNAQTMVRFPQHLDILSKYFLPLVFLFAYQLLEKPSLARSFLTWLFFTLNALTVNYYQIFSIVMLPLVALPFLWSNFRKKNWGYFGRLGKYGLVGLIFLPILLYFNLPYLDFSKKEGAFRPLEAIPFFSARITDYFASSPDNFLYGGFVKAMDYAREPKDDRGIINYEEHSLFLGVIPIILFFLGLKKFHKQNLNHGFFYLLLILSFILTFGPYFNGASSGLPLPFYFLYKLVPMMEGVRSPVRFEFLFFIPFALIASYGVLWILEKKVRGAWVVGVILALLLLENSTIRNFDVRSESLAAVSDIGRGNLMFLEGRAALHLPIYDLKDADNFGNNSAYLNFVPLTGQKIVNGNSSYLPPDHLALLDAATNMSENILAILKNLGVEYIIIHKDKLTNVSTDEAKLLIFDDKTGVVFENNDLKIINLSFYPYTVAICKPSDIDLQVSQVKDENLDISWAIVLQNKSSCFLLSPGEEKYKETEAEIGGKLRKIKYRMPLVITPNQQVILSEINREISVE